MNIVRLKTRQVGSARQKLAACQRAVSTRGVNARAVGHSRRLRGGRVRALAEVRVAHDGFRAAGAGGVKELVEVETWLARHSVRQTWPRSPASATACAGRGAARARGVSVLMNSLRLRQFKAA